jgi:hypothetical protein
MILVLSLRLAGGIQRRLYTYAPSNRLIRHLRSPGGRRLAFPTFAAFAVGYLAAVVAVTSIIESGGPGWLNMVALVCAWNAIKFILVGLAEGMRFTASVRRRRPRAGTTAVGGFE